MNMDSIVCQFPPCGKPLEMRKKANGSPRKFCSQQCRTGMQYYRKIKEYLDNEAVQDKFREAQRNLEQDEAQQLQKEFDRIEQKYPDPDPDPDTGEGTV